MVSRQLFKQQEYQQHRAY